MDAIKPRRLILGQGFAGAPTELSLPRELFACSTAELAHLNPFECVETLERDLGPGEVLAGYLSYECASVTEASLDLPPPPIDAPAACFGIFTSQATIDLETPSWPSRTPAPLRVDEGQTPSAYAERVEQIIERIGRGDVFQVNYSHRQSAELAVNKVNFLEQLPWKEAIRARFGALIDLGEYSVLSASPELFLSLDGRNLATEPIKGTRPRGATADEDRDLLDDLINDPKDRAENIMIADLMRNDLAKVSEDGSIREPALCEPQSLPAVHHLYSRIEGTLRPGLGFADALKACFPCGSVTGAPKIAAMNAISELEGEGRGPYCGTIFYRTKERAAASVAIRTAVLDHHSGRVDVRSGGGVTILSDPYKEYQEALDKGYLFRMLAGLE